MAAVMIPIGYEFFVSGAKLAYSALKKLAAATTALTFAAVTAYAKLDQNLREANTLFPQYGDESREYIRQWSRDIANDLNISTNEIVEAFKVAGGAGIDFSSSLDFASASAKFARGAFTDVRTASNLLVTAINAFNISASDMEATADKLAVTLDEGVFDNIQSLVASFATAAPSASALGIAIEEMSAALAIMTRSGYSAEVAGVAINRMLLSLSRSSSKVNQTFRDVTGDSFPNFIAKGGDLIDALMILDDHLTEAQKSAFELFSTVDERGRRAFENLRQNFPEYIQLLDDLGASHGNLDKRVDEALGGISAKWDGFKVMLGQVLESIGKKINDSIQGWLAGVDSFTDAFANTIEAWLNGHEQFLESKLSAVDALFDGHYDYLLQHQALYTDASIKLEGERIAAKDKLFKLEKVKMELQQQLVGEIFKKYGVHLFNALMRLGLMAFSALAKGLQLLIQGILRGVREIVNLVLKGIGNAIAAGLNAILELLQRAFNLIQSGMDKVTNLISRIPGINIEPSTPVDWGGLSFEWGLPKYENPPGFRDDWFSNVYDGLDDAFTLDTATRDNTIAMLQAAIAGVDTGIEELTDTLRATYPQLDPSRDPSVTKDPVLEAAKKAAKSLMEQAVEAAIALENLQRHMGSYEEALELTTDEALPNWAKKLAEAGYEWEDLTWQVQWLIIAERDRARAAEAVAEEERRHAAALKMATDTANGLTAAMQALWNSTWAVHDMKINPITGQVMGKGPQAANQGVLDALIGDREKFKEFYNQFWQIDKDQREAFFKQAHESGQLPEEVNTWQLFKQWGREVLKGSMNVIKNQQQLAQESLNAQEKYAQQEHAYRMAGIGGYSIGDYQERLLVLEERLAKAKLTPGLEDDRKYEYEIAQITHAINNMVDKEQERQRREGATINVYVNVAGDIRNDKEIEDTVVKAVGKAIRQNKITI